MSVSKVALIIGGSRGIGRQIALTLATESNFKLVVAAKTVDGDPNGKLPGSVHSVCSEVREKGGIAIPIKCDVRYEAEITDTVSQAIEHFGRLDALIYNAGAILWESVKDTSTKKYDLMHAVNSRGAYIAVQECLPYFLNKNSGKIILVSQPIYSRFFRGKTPYAMTKTAMTVLTMGLGMELEKSGVSITSLWPATVIESFVTQRMNVPKRTMRKSTIFADACLALLNEESQRYNGHAVLDEDVLRDKGVTDFSVYRGDPDAEPIRMMPRKFPDLKVIEQDFDLKLPNTSNINTKSNL